MKTIHKIALAAATAATLSAPLPLFAQDAAPVETAASGPNYFPNSSTELLELVKDCDTEACMSYVSGAIGGIAVYALIAEKPSPFCTRGDVDKDDIREAIINTIESTPALEDQHPTVAILAAFGRYWPCMSQEEIETLQSTALTSLESSFVADLVNSDQHALILGNPDAAPERTIIVFHDQNCSHCRRFRNETDALAGRGWKVMIYPVATSSDESAGYGAVEIALRDLHPKAAEALYRNDPASLADITLAMKIAEGEGVATKDILTAIAKGGAYEAVESNTRAFFDAGAKGTPSWIIGTSLYSGFLTADAIQEIADTFEGDEGKEEVSLDYAPTAEQEPTSTEETEAGASEAGEPAADAAAAAEGEEK